jgi:VPDSG-CTERM motif
MLITPMKKFVTCALIGFALVLNAAAAPEEKDKDKPPVIIVDKIKDKDKDKGPVYSAPDNGSTALLLGTAFLALGVARRRLATR